MLNHTRGGLLGTNPGHAANDSVGGVAGAEGIFIPDAILDDHDGGGGADGGREGIRDDVVELECFVRADDVGVGGGGFGGCFEDCEAVSWRRSDSFVCDIELGSDWRGEGARTIPRTDDMLAVVRAVYFQAMLL